MDGDGVISKSDLQRVLLLIMHYQAQEEPEPEPEPEEPAPDSPSAANSRPPSLGAGDETPRAWGHPSLSGRAGGKKGSEVVRGVGTPAPPVVTPAWQKYRSTLDVANAVVDKTFRELGNPSAIDYVQFQQVRLAVRVHPRVNPFRVLRSSCGRGTLRRSTPSSCSPLRRA